MIENCSTGVATRCNTRTSSLIGREVANCAAISPALKRKLHLLKVLSDNGTPSGDGIYLIFHYIVLAGYDYYLILKVIFHIQTYY